MGEKINEIHPFVTVRWVSKLNEQISEDKWCTSNSYFGYFPNQEIKSIFLGTFPIYEISLGENCSQNYEFFYGSNQNQFWPIMRGLMGKNICKVEEMIDVLDFSNLGITDILREMVRNPEKSNADSNLKAIRYNDFYFLKNKLPVLQNVFVTSGGKGPVAALNQTNGSASVWLRDSLQKFNPTGFNKNGFIKNIRLQGGKQFRLISLYSPSNSANVAITGVLNKNNNFNVDKMSIDKFRVLQWGYFLRKFHFSENEFPLIDRVYNFVEKNRELKIFFDD